MSKDYLTKDGANQLAQQIRRYWASRGFDVTVTVESGKFEPPLRSAYSYVRSDMRNGWPVRKRIQ